MAKGSKSCGPCGLPSKPIQNVVKGNSLGPKSGKKK